jgi:hypothetical protein
MVNIRVGIAKHVTRAAFTCKGFAAKTYSGKVTHMVVPRRVERYRTTEIGFESEENFVARSEGY